MPHLMLGKFFSVFHSSLELGLHVLQLLGKLHLVGIPLLDAPEVRARMHPGLYSNALFHLHSAVLILVGYT